MQYFLKILGTSLEKVIFNILLKISDRSVKICSSYVSGQLKKSGFEKNAFKVLSTVKFGHLDIFFALHLLVYYF